MEKQANTIDAVQKSEENQGSLTALFASHNIKKEDHIALYEDLKAWKHS